MAAWQPGPRQLGAIKAALFLLALVPLANMAWRVFSGDVVEPLEYLTRGTGDWTLYLLCVTLTVTPLRRLSGMNWLIKLRRMAGLFCFFYAVLHFTCFLWFDHFFDVQGMLRDVARRPFILVGFTAFVLLIPLAVTSTNAMVRRLGGKRWQWLHRLVYVIAVLAVLHFWWMKAGKNDLAQPALFAAIVAVLLGYRIVVALHKRRGAAEGAASAPGRPVENP